MAAQGLPVSKLSTISGKCESLVARSMRSANPSTTRQNWESLPAKSLPRDLAHAHTREKKTGDVAYNQQRTSRDMKTRQIAACESERTGSHKVQVYNETGARRWRNDKNSIWQISHTRRNHPRQNLILSGTRLTDNQRMIFSYLGIAPAAFTILQITEPRRCNACLLRRPD